MGQRADRHDNGAAARSWVWRAGPAGARYPLSARTLLAALLVAATPLPAAAEWVQRGEASWYGARHHNKRMADGRRFDMRAATVAHRTLPLGSRVRVRNLVNGREAVARVTDRGPYAKGRVLDLSRGLARALHAETAGVVLVEIRRED